MAASNGSEAFPCGWRASAGKPNEFGKMVKLQEAESQIIIDYKMRVAEKSDF
jgi:transposase, IS5 family